MPEGILIDERVHDFFETDNFVVVTHLEDENEHADEIEALRDRLDTELVWREWQEGFNHQPDNAVADGQVAVTVNGKYHPFDEGAESCMGHAVLLPRELADEDGYPCVNIPDAPEPAPVEESDVPEFDSDELADEQSDGDFDIPTTEADFKREERKRERVETVLKSELDVDWNDLRVFDLTEIYGRPRSPYFSFNVETTTEARRGLVDVTEDGKVDSVEIVFEGGRSE